jgi:hypothetical protein
MVCTPSDNPLRFCVTFPLRLGTTYCGASPFLGRHHPGPKGGKLVADSCSLGKGVRFQREPFLVTLAWTIRRSDPGDSKSQS